MTKKERVEKLKHFITCLKCEVSGKSCDVNCSTQYGAGNMGEIIENLEEIAKVLEQEPCDDAVRRTEVIDELNRLGRNAFKDDTDYDNFFAFVDSLPSVTPQEPKPIVEIDLYSVIKQKYIEREVLDKIRAEIEDWQTDVRDNDAEIYDFIFERIYEIFDEYKAGSEEV